MGMEATEPGTKPGQTEPPEPKREGPASQLPSGAPDGLAAAANGGEVDDDGERGALDFLLGPTKAVTYDLPVELDTPEGQQTLIFKLQQLDGDRILELERQHTKGSGPFALLDDLSFNAALAVEATTAIVDKKSGRSVDPKSSEFRERVPDPAIAMKARFKYQSGLLDGVAGQIRRISGYAPDRVGSAERAMSDAAGNS